MSEQFQKAGALIDAQHHLLAARENLLAAEKLLRSCEATELADEVNALQNNTTTTYFKIARRWIRVTWKHALKSARAEAKAS